MSLMKLRAFSTTWEAGMAKSLLEAEGIRGVVTDADMSAGMPYPISSQHGIGLLVDESDFDRAAQVLADWDASTPLATPEGEDDTAEGEEPEGESGPEEPASE